MTDLHLRVTAGQPPPPPPDLAASGRILWIRISSDFKFEDSASLALLAEGCRAADLLEAARAQLASSGPVFRDRWGQPKTHPAAAVARDSRAGLLACLRAIGVTSTGVAVAETGAK